jgi:RNA polymerase sigma-70 factor (ECF subfamily)
VERHSQDLFRLARGFSSNAADAEDAVQDTLISAFRWIGGFDGRSSLLTWMSRILIRRAGKLAKARARRNAVSLDQIPEGPGRDVKRTNDSAGHDLRLDLAAVLPTLAVGFREVIVLREMRGLSYGEIAAVLKIPQGTVESRIHRARIELRRLLCAYRT